VTKFRENRLTLKGRSAGQRHTDTHADRQTNSAKIRALQVCNRTNNDDYMSYLAERSLQKQR